jgi:hypothetical protein
MRQLNAKQKKFLVNLIENKDFSRTDDFENGEFGELEAMGDHETLYQNANRFMSDYRISKLNN